MADGSLRVAVTGAAGYLGSKLIERLEECDTVGYILATDIRRSTSTYGERTQFVRLDVSEPFPTILGQHDIGAVVHLAYVLNPCRRRSQARKVNVLGAENLVEACRNSGVAHIVYLSSTSVYGAHPDNPEFVTEEDPVRPIPGFQYSEDKVAAERRLTDFADESPSASVTILRGCPVMGPRADNFIANAFRKPILPLVGDADPPMQFIHEDDLTDLILKCLETRTEGVYNVAGNGTIRWTQMAEAMRRRMLRLPPVAWRSLTSLAWNLGLQSDSPACGLDFIRYRWTASADKLKRELGVSPTYTSREAWESFATQAGQRRL